jgi:hypothetical protein
MPIPSGAPLLLGRERETAELDEALDPERRVSIFLDDSGIALGERVQLADSSAEVATVTTCRRCLTPTFSEFGDGRLSAFLNICGTR